MYDDKKRAQRLAWRRSLTCHVLNQVIDSFPPFSQWFRSYQYHKFIKSRTPWGGVMFYKPRCFGIDFSDPDTYELFWEGYEATARGESRTEKRQREKVAVRERALRAARCTCPRCPSDMPDKVIDCGR